MPLGLATAIFLPIVGLIIWGGQLIPLVIPGAWPVRPQLVWNGVILGYCFLASIVPLWLLLQPRGYLGGFVLYMALAVGVIGIFFGGFEVKQDYFKTWVAPGLTGALFPFLFVTIACGACSGFHGLVCSGTTSKQVAKESHCRPVGYGGMLLEGFVAIIALATIMILAPGEVSGPPGAIYGAGIGRFLSLIIGKENLIFAITFGAMAFSTFVFDTLDVTTRLGRCILEEVYGGRSFYSRLFATALTLGIPAYFILTAPPGGWMAYWVIFGTSNQLLAALTLLTITVWLKRNGKPYWFTLIPMLFVMTITLWSLVKQVKASYATWTAGEATGIVITNGVAAFLFILLALLLIAYAIPRLRSGTSKVGSKDLAGTVVT
jgi:carbon starvation protein